MDSKTKKVLAGGVIITIVVTSVALIALFSIRIPNDGTPSSFNLQWAWI